MTSEIINKAITKKLIDKLSIVVEEIKKDVLQKKVKNPEIYKTNTDIEKLLVNVPWYIDEHELVDKLAPLLGATANKTNLIIDLREHEVQVNFNVNQAFVLLRHYKACLTPLNYNKTTSVAWTPKSNYRTIAEELGSEWEAQRRVIDSVDNLETAKNSGNKKMVELFTKEVEKWTEIRDIAHHIDWEAVAREKLIRECLPVQEFIEKNNINKQTHVVDEIQPFFKEYGISLGATEVYELFEKFKVDPINDDVVIFSLYVANEAKSIIVTDPEILHAGGQTKTISINDYLDKLKNDQIIAKQTFDKNYRTKTGSYKKISHRAASTRYYFEKKIARADCFIEKFSIHIDKIKELNGESIGV